MDTKEWIKKGRHLPMFLRDFHDQKDVFKTIDRLNSENKESPHYVPWTSAQVYVIDTFLRAMAACGWTLQRAPKTRTYVSLTDEIRKRKEQEIDMLNQVFTNRS